MELLNVTKIKELKRKELEKNIYNCERIMFKRKWHDLWDKELTDFLFLGHRKYISFLAGKYLNGKNVLVLGASSTEAEIVKNLCKSVTCINISKRELENAKKAGYPKGTKFVLGDAENTGFKEGSFEIIICNGSLHHLNIYIAIKEIKRLLKPDGVLFIVGEPGLLNPTAFIGRKFFRTNAHTPYEKPFIFQNLRYKLREAGFEERESNCYFLFSQIFPIFSKFTGIKKLKTLIRFSLALEHILLKTLLREFAWIFVGVYQK